MADFFLQTARLKLRPFVPSDAQFMFDLNSDPEVVRHTGDGAFKSYDEAKLVVESLMRQFQEKRMGRFVVTDLVSGQSIGWCGLKWHSEEQEVDLGYRFFKNQWGKGYATETSARCLDYGFNELNLPKIVAHAEIKNVASVRVLQKLGFQKAGVSKYKGLVDAEDFAIFRKDYLSSR